MARPDDFSPQCDTWWLILANSSQNHSWRNHIWAKLHARWFGARWLSSARDYGWERSCKCSCWTRTTYSKAHSKCRIVDTCRHRAQCSHRFACRVAKLSTGILATAIWPDWWDSETPNTRNRGQIVLNMVRLWNAVYPQPRTNIIGY